MDKIATISELLQLSGSSYRIYDLGRKVTKLGKQEFEKVEQAMQPYPMPIQGHACFSIVFWQQTPEQPYIWFVKLPLDERGLLNQGARNHYLAIILEALGNDLGQDPSEKQEQLLKENPYNFKPTQYKLATLNACIKRDLKQKASEYYEHCQLYLSGSIGWDNWQGVGVQGLCDFAARIECPENEQALIKALQHLPEDVFTPLCSALENQSFSIDLLNEFIALGQLELAKDELDQIKLANIIRGMSSNGQHPFLQSFIGDVINNVNVIDLNLLLTISGRTWLALTELEQLTAFLEKLVSIVSQDIFMAVFQDLIALPSIRPLLLQCIRNPQRSGQLGNAIGLIFAQVKGQ